MAIKKYERTNFDMYEGPRDELLSAGLVRTDQIPPSGKNGISFLNGAAIKGRCPVDENYLRVDRLIEGRIRVKVGVPTEVARERCTAERIDAAARRARYLQEQAAMEQQELSLRARIAKRRLNRFIRSEAEYRQYLARGVRQTLKIHLDFEASPVMHAYSLDAESLAEALLSCDAVVEVLMAAKVKFDVTRHNELLGKLQRDITAADPHARAQVKRLTQPNAAILEGETA